MSSVEDKFNNAPIHTNEFGGKQSQLDFRFDLLPPIAIRILSHVLWYGSTRYSPNNWRKIDIPDHLNHALFHIFSYIEGDTKEEHLSHALARLSFAVELENINDKP